jgi:hypothetical protein
MAFRLLKSFFPTADGFLQQDFSTLGGVLLAHLKSYEGLNTVYQHAGLQGCQGHPPQTTEICVVFLSAVGE